jgi:hypothetical protein
MVIRVAFIAYYEEVAGAMNKINWSFVAGAMWAGCVYGIYKLAYQIGKDDGKTEAYRDAADAAKDLLIKNMELDNTDLEEEI